MEYETMKKSEETKKALSKKKTFRLCRTKRKLRICVILLKNNLAVIAKII